VGNRIVASVPASAAGQAVMWANELARTGRIEEFSLTPATLEDAYVALVGATQLNGNTEESNVRAA
jgi:ABC-2 type transport system ATP-binding protein